MDTSIKPTSTVSIATSPEMVDRGACSTMIIDASRKKIVFENDDEIKRKTLESSKKIAGYSVVKLHSSPLHKNIVDQLLRIQPDLDVDQVSYQTMVDSLAFSGINTMEQVESLNLRIIPPGPVFHTWWAKYGTGIFDSTNNPDHLTGLNYVSRIEKQAERLKQWDIPVFIVYLERDMQESELIKMRKLFEKHENIVMLSVESDLTSLSSYRHYLDPNSFQLLDDVRFAICKEFPVVLSAVKNKAAEKSKFEYVKRLEAMKGKSIIYSDIDNTFIRRPLYQITSNGFRHASVVSKKFRFFGDYDMDNAPSTISRHMNYFVHEGVYCKKMERFNSDYLLKSADSLYEYLLSGEAFATYKQIGGLLDLNTDSVFGNDVGYITIDEKSLDMVKKSFRCFPGLEWMETVEEAQPSDYRVKNMLGLQQIKQLHCGRDGTWMK